METPTAATVGGTRGESLATREHARRTGLEKLDALFLIDMVASFRNFAFVIEGCPPPEARFPG
jgi:hypothetical protein